MMNWLHSAALGSWQPTLIGILIAMVVTLNPIINSGRLPTWNEALLALLSVIGGLVTKQHNKVGAGTPGDPIR